MRLLCIGYVWPEPRSSAAGVHTWGILESALAAGWEVHFASAAAESIERGSRSELDARGVRTHSILLNDGSFDAWVSKLAPEVVVFDRFVVEEQFGWRVYEQVPGALRVVDSQDLHFLRRQRERLSGARLTWSVPNEDLERELASFWRSDAVIVLSSFERELLVREFGFPAERIIMNRFLYRQWAPGLDWSARTGFGWIGNFRHPPNADGLRWLLGEIWPLVRKQLPAATLRVWGSYPSKEFSEMCVPGVEFMGEAASVGEALGSVRVSLAALRFGAGIKGKVSDSWVAGTPVVGSAIAAEGMTELEIFGGAVADDAREFASAAVELHQDEKAWAVARDRGFAILEAEYSFEFGSRALVEALGVALQARAERRARDWMGAMLWREDRRSGKYFSKWIEEKNRVK